MEQVVVKVEHPEDSQTSESGEYRLRARRNKPNYQATQSDEENSDVQASDDETSESDETNREDAGDPVEVNELDKKRRTSKSVDSTKPFGCTLCEMRYSSKMGLKQHHVMKHLEKRFKCKGCDQKFATKSRMERHLVVHMAQEEKPFKCNDCQKRFSNQTTFKNHRLSFHTERKLCCPTCGERFGSNKNFQGHLTIHLKGHADKFNARGTSSNADPQPGNDDVPIVVLNSNGRENELSAQSSTMTGPKLKIVFDEEYRPSN